ncbi:zinc ABC transporter substrate-binding protein [Ectothiorhodospiraceae bacterium 2226]|nr:zinc ABC transporter substrate-binding protein [Ectothiorhodospiraceae bacterium 2226]
MSRPALLLLIWLLLAPVAAVAEGPRVAASILPVHSLSAALMADVGEPRLVIPANASPHAHSLRPSEARALADAELVVWIGPEMESLLVRPLRTLGVRAEILTLRDADGVVTRPLRANPDWQAHDHAHGSAAAIDGHLWLDPHNARHMARAIAAALARLDPPNAALYARNLATLERRLEALDAELNAQLAPLRDAPYYVFHDAYQYLEARYGLDALGAISLSPERAPGARRLRALRAALGAQQARCVFSEPQFDAAIVGTLIEDTGIRHGVLDPLGADIAPGPDAYFVLMRRLGAELAECLEAGETH